ncbi:hypothetical protein SDC9_67678 [bioreactor metagenome]|uniref:Uncharacterized protein n=1 Tax=bioreactor metagenome TaxID=1076179 RepID=A0A644Y4Y2_9ZZZZ
MAPADRKMSSSDVNQFDTEMRMATIPFQTLPPAQQVPSSWTCSVTVRVKASPSDPGQENLTRTWFSTTSLRMLTMGSSDRSNAMSRACRQFRSTISRTPFLPRLFRPQYRGKPRALREDSGTHWEGSRTSPSPAI